ncbi:MAG: TolB family protein [Solirubrobacterales bacterium]
MTIDDRARRAAHDFRRSIEDLGGSDGERSSLERFDRIRRRRQRGAQIAATVVASAVALAALLVLTRAFSKNEQPAGPSSHNGRIVYGRSAVGESEVRLYTIDPDGTGEIALPVSFTDCAEWSPDGTKLHVTASEYPGSPLRPAVIDADGTGFTLLNGISNPNLNLGCGDWSPDGSRLVVEGFPQKGARDLDGIYTVRASDGGGLTLVSRNPFGGFDAVPQFSPDGSQIVFFRDDPHRHLPHDVGALYVIGADGTGLRRVTPWGLAAAWGSFSPDGRWIVFADPRGDLDLVHPDGTGLTRVPLDLGGGQPLQPRWSPDGTMIVFGYSTNGQGDIYTVHPDGSGLVQITNTPTVDERWPDWGTSAG